MDKLKRYFVKRSHIQSASSDNIAGLRSLYQSAQYDGLIEIEIKGALVATEFGLEEHEPK